MQNLVEKIWADIGFTALLVTHDVSEAVRLADRIVLIEDGNIALDVSVDHPRPRSLAQQELVELEEKVLNRIIHGSSHKEDEVKQVI